MRGGADAPANDLPSISIDHESHICELLPGCEIGEIARHCPRTNGGQWLAPKHVRRGHPELAVHFVQRTGLLFVGDRRSVRLASDNALNIHVLHQPRDRAAHDSKALAAQLVPDLAHAVDAPVLLEDAPDIWPQRLSPARTILSVVE